jgi:hypothetical protein
MLTYTRRCFGDKGDVEDITEGQQSSTYFTLNGKEAALLAEYASVYHTN